MDFLKEFAILLILVVVEKSSSFIRECETEVLSVCVCELIL